MPVRKGKIQLACQQCGLAFAAWPYMVGIAKYCSRRCHNDAMATGTDPYRGRTAGIGAEHIRIATAALGKSLPTQAEVHHVNGNGRDNRHANLVICQDHAYHQGRRPHE